MDSKQNGDDKKVEMLDFSEKEKDRVQKGKPNIFASVKAKVIGLLDGFKKLSIERQTYILVGAAMIFSLLIGVFGDLIVIVLAAGILFVGISGRPFFAKFLKKMSWNKESVEKRKDEAREVRK